MLLVIIGLRIFLRLWEISRCEDASNAHNLRKYIEYSKQHTRYNVTDESKSLLSFSFLLIINYVHLLLLTRRNEALWNDCTVGKLSSPSRALSEEEIFCNLKVAKRITLNSYEKYISRGVHANASRTLSLYFMGVTKQKMLYKRRLNKALSKSCNKSMKYGGNGLVVSVL